MAKPWLQRSPVTIASARSNHSCGNMGLEGLVDFERKLGLTGCSIAWGVGAAQICQNPCAQCRCGKPRRSTWKGIQTKTLDLP